MQDGPAEFVRASFDPWNLFSAYQARSSDMQLDGIDEAGRLQYPLWSSRAFCERVHVRPAR